MKRAINIKYNWVRGDADGEVLENHIEQLEDIAKERISEMMQSGYLAGELFATIDHTTDDDGDGVEYTGWFDVEFNNQ